MWGSCNSLVLFLVTYCILADNVVHGYRPVILMHGLLGSPAESTQVLQERILRAHPGTPVHNIDAYNDGDSLKPMWEQVHGVYSIIAPILDSSPQGAILIGFSQGGVVFRGILQTYPTHNITFIAIASPIAGQYGTTEVNHIIPLVTKEFVYQFCYMGGGVQKVSICDWWKDPTRLELYKKHNNFLYELESPTNTDYKRNFERLGNLILIGGPDDGIVEPWQSSHFSFYDKNMEIVDCVDQEFYVKNSFGLRTLDDSGRLHLHTLPGFHHYDFRTDQKVFDCCILPWLD